MAENTDRRMVFDQEASLDSTRVDPVILFDRPTDHELMSQLYRRLKKNSDGQLNYWLGDDFHYGEMEMLRLAPPRTGRFPRLRSTWKKHISLIALYRYSSAYGNNYRRPASLIATSLLVFALVYPALGLRDTTHVGLLSFTYSSAWSKQDSFTRNLVHETRVFGAGLMVALDVATLQKSGDLVPVYPLGRALSVFQTVVTTILFALFLLAIRRQFRR